MKIFDKDEHSFGRVKAKTKMQTTFNYLGQSGIKKVETSCGCTTTIANGNIIKVNLVINSIPKHLKYKNSYKVVKSITVTTNDDNKHILKLTAEIYE